MAKCNKCSKSISDTCNNRNVIKCNFCTCVYHKRCVYGNIDDVDWMCFDCTGELFPFNHILDDNEFKFCLAYLNHSFDYNKLLSMRFNPFMFNDLVDNELPRNLFIPNSSSSCNYYFDCSLDFDVSFQENFSILHLNSRQQEP